MTDVNREALPSDADDRLAHGAYAPLEETVPITRESAVVTVPPAGVEKHGTHTLEPVAVMPPIVTVVVLPYCVHASAPVDGSDREDRIVPELDLTVSRVSGAADSVKGEAPSPTRNTTMDEAGNTVCVGVGVPDDDAVEDGVFVAVRVPVGVTVATGDDVGT